MRVGKVVFSLNWGGFLILYLFVRKNEREREAECVCVGGFDLPRVAISRHLQR